MWESITVTPCYNRSSTLIERIAKEIKSKEHILRNDLNETCFLDLVCKYIKCAISPSEHINDAAGDSQRLEDDSLRISLN